MSKQLYTLEYPVRCSPSILYEFLSTPAGLGEWFADKVDERDDTFYFGWNGNGPDFRGAFYFPNPFWKFQD